MRAKPGWGDHTLGELAEGPPGSIPRRSTVNTLRSNIETSDPVGGTGAVAHGDECGVGDEGAVPGDLHSRDRLLGASNSVCDDRNVEWKQTRDFRLMVDWVKCEVELVAGCYVRIRVHSWCLFRLINHDTGTSSIYRRVGSPLARESRTWPVWKVCSRLYRQGRYSVLE